MDTVEKLSKIRFALKDIYETPEEIRKRIEAIDKRISTLEKSVEDICAKNIVFSRLKREKKKLLNSKNSGENEKTIQIINEMIITIEDEIKGKFVENNILHKLKEEREELMILLGSLSIQAKIRLKIEAAI